MRDKVALFDMDSTLCDFDGAMRRDLLRLASPEDIRLSLVATNGGTNSSLFDERLPHIEARRDFIKRQPGWWLKLERLQHGFDLLQVCKDIGFNIHVLTKGPYKTTPAWGEKAQWCREHLPGVPVTISEDKGLVYGRVLVDDWPQYFTRWLEWRPRGLVIVPAHPWNADVVHPNVIRYDGVNKDQVRKALQESFDR